MAHSTHQRTVLNTLERYVATLRAHGVNVWRLYLFGSQVTGKARPESDIDVAVFIDKKEIDTIDELMKLMKLRREVDLDIEPHAFTRSDFNEPDPFVASILATGQRIV